MDFSEKTPFPKDPFFRTYYGPQIYLVYGLDASCEGKMPAKTRELASAQGWSCDSKSRCDSKFTAIVVNLLPVVALLVWQGHLGPKKKGHKTNKISRNAEGSKNPWVVNPDLLFLPLDNDEENHQKSKDFLSLPNP